MANEGGPAFPLPEVRDWINKQNVLQYPNQGMSLRQWYAGLAIAPLIAAQPPGMIDLKMVSMRAFQMADEMIERSRYL